MQLTATARTILVLEDEPAHADAIRRSLFDPVLDCRILIAGSIKEFNRIIRDRTPDFVIADINLPDGSALSLLKGDLESQPWPVLIMTSYGDEEIAVKAIKSGAIDYIVKSEEAFSNINHVVKRNFREWRNIQRSRESERKFRNLFETMDQGVIYIDTAGRITAANSASEKITGYSLHEMQAIQFFKPGPWVNLKEDSPFPPVEKHPVLTALNSGLPQINKVMGLRKPRTEKTIWLLVSAIPQFRRDESEPHEVFTTMTDITQLKETEIELKNAKEKAEESDRLKSVFMANMSHEIRTPMNGILGFAELLRSPELSGESQEMYVDAIRSSGKRMLNIVNDLIDISRIEAGQTEIRKETTNVPSLIRELMLFFRPEAGSKKIQLRSKAELPADYTVNTDKTKLAQIITNLLKNALKFTPDSGTIELGSKIDNNDLLFYVKDNGRGIRKELQEKIFERFRQGDQAESHEGVGLGLAISKAYAEMLGGRIWLESEPGTGSVFYFTVPSGEVSANIEKSSVQSGNEPASGSCILVAEDDEISYTLIRELLKKRGIHTCHARDGREAVDLIKNIRNISMTLMDIKLPVLNGLDAAREIKKIRPEMPVIAQSAYISQADIRQALDAGCDDYITKPIDISILLNKIEKYNLPVS
ncbi:MAG TPA: response regulator [Bacteroidales bacterium]|jgi:signal transduction histidine kinase/DNA-binding response OmpR family regulator|nr:response regulator [Bacteroidales bacterium]